MECKNIQYQFTAYIEKSLSEVESSEIESHLKSCSNCTKELEEMTSFLSVLNSGELETPSANLKLNFDKMLAKEITLNKPKMVQLEPKQDWEFFLRIAASIAIVLSAFFIGKHQSKINTIASNEVVSKKKTAVLAMLKEDSASKRILAISNSENYTTNDTKIIQALINRLFFDKNTNVRLAAAEALSKFSSEEMVKTALIKSLETEKSASIQIELIQILTKIQEKRAVKPMQELLKNEEVLSFVKQQVTLNLPNLL